MTMEVIVYNAHTSVSTKALDQFVVSLDRGSQEQRDALVESACQVELVEDEFTQNLAVETLAQLGRFLKDAETSRKALKAPVTKLGKKIEEVFDQGIRGVEQHRDRIKKMLNDYTAKLLRAQQEAQRKQQEEMERLEAQRREVEQKLAMEADAKKREALEHARKDVIETEKSVMTMPVPQAKPEGTKMLMKWEYELDLRLLATAYPQFCKIEAKIREINAALEAGLIVPGVINAKKVPDVRV